MAKSIIRVAVAQFETGKDRDRVLGDILRFIDEAAAGGAQLVHFQECCNYPTSFIDRAEAWETSIAIPGPMVNSISAKAEEHGLYVGFNASVRDEFPKAYMVNHLIGPDGLYIGSNKKQVLMWLERDFYAPSDEENLVFDTDIGRIGLLSCMDGLIPETSRTLAVQGADIVLNSLCSNALDEARLHIPARAAENGYYMIAANRIGDMVQGQDLQDLMDAAGMTREFVAGAGESQVSGPNGKLVARGSLDKAEIIFADIDLELAAQQRADRLSRRRPDCYGLLTMPNAELGTLYRERPEAGVVSITTIVPAANGFDAILTECQEMLGQVSGGLAVLPELFAWTAKDMTAGAELRGQVDSAVQMLQTAAAERNLYIVAGVPEMIGNALTNRAMLFGPDGLIGQYRQIHRDPALGWTLLGDELPVFDLPFGRLAMLLGADLLFPEAARVLARKGADIIACPATWREDWHYDLMLPERSAESHMTIVGVGRGDSPIARPAQIVTTPTAYRFPETKEVNTPDRFGPVAVTGTFCVQIDLSPNRDKRLMGSTDLIADSQPRLYARLTAPVGAA